MTTSDYVKIALESIAFYKEYIEQKRIKKPSTGKSVSNINSRDKYNHDNKVLYILKLSRRIFSIDSIELTLHGISSHDHWKDELRFVKWDDKESVLIIETSKSLSVKIDATPLSEMKICSDMMFLVRRLEEWYKNSQYTGKLSSPKCFPSLSAPNTNFFAETPSEEQAAALHSIFNNAFTYIWGAPGTGKTKFVLSYALMHYMRAGKKVIVTAPTNNAVDQTLLGVLKAIEENNLSTHSVFRLGVPGRELSEKYPHVCEYQREAKEKEAAKAALELIEHIKPIKEYNERLEEEKKIVFDYANTHREEYKKLDEQILLRNSLKTESLALEVELQRLNDNIKKQLSDIGTVQSNIEHLLSRRNHVDDKINNLCSKPAILRFLEKSKISSLEIEIRNIDDSISKSRVELSRLLVEYNKNCLEKETLENRFIKCRNMHKDAVEYVSQKLLRFNPELKKFEKKFNLSFFSNQTVPQASSANLDLLERIVSSIPTQPEPPSEFSPLSILELDQKAIELKEIVDNYTEKEENRFESSNIIAGTIDTIVGRYDLFNNHRKEIAHIFIDEAAYSPIIKSMICYSFECPITMLGDHMQLPPVCEVDMKGLPDSDKLLAVLWVQSAIHTTDVFRFSINDLFNQYTNHPYEIPNNTVCCSLNRSYRFSEKIASILSNHVYSSVFRGTSNNNTKIIVLNAPRLLLGHRENEYEAKAINTYLANVDINDFAVLTPYTNQQRLLSKGLSHTAQEPSIMTVHASQGREWDTVFLSVTDTTDKFLTNSLNPISDGLRVINTAVSRAKKELIIACDYDYWISQPKQLICKIIEQADEIITYTNQQRR